MVKPRSRSSRRLRSGTFTAATLRALLLFVGLGDDHARRGRSFVDRRHRCWLGNVFVLSWISHAWAYPTRRNAHRLALRGEWVLEVDELGMEQMGQPRRHQIAFAATEHQAPRQGPPPREVLPPVR